MLAALALNGVTPEARCPWQLPKLSVVNRLPAQVPLDVSLAPGQTALGLRVRNAAGTSLLSLDQNGLLTLSANGSAASGGGAVNIATGVGLYSPTTNRLDVGCGGASRLEVFTGGLCVGSGGVYGISSNASPDSQGPGDTAWSRISAGLVGVGTGAQGSVAGSMSFTNLTLAGAVSKVNNVATVGVCGVGTIRANAQLTGQTTTIGSVAGFTPTADGDYILCAEVRITASSTFNFTVIYSYTDEGGNARTGTMNFSNLAGTIATAMANAGGATVYAGIPLQIRAKSGAGIAIGTTGTFTSVTYNITASIIQLS